MIRILDTTFNASVVYGYLVDSRDGQTYRTAKIGTQTWMAQNLNFQVDSSWWYGSLAENGARYGRLYRWAEAMGGTTSSQASPSAVQGVCPSGWHIPSDAEWTLLQDYADPSRAADGTRLKSVSGWDSSGNGTDEFGFRALPAGSRSSDGTFSYSGKSGNWWSATEYSTYFAWFRDLDYDVAYGNRNLDDKGMAFSLRCAQD